VTAAPTADGATGPVAGTTAGTASEYRRRRSAVRAERWGLYARIAAGAVIVVALLVIVTARPTVPGSVPGPTPPPTTVSFGSPAVSQISCAQGTSAYAERIPWVSTSAPVTSGDLVPHVIELFDGDIVYDPGASPNASATNVCQGASPVGNQRWYVVLSTPAGANVLTYTIEQGWAGIGGGPANLGIANDSSLTIVSNQDFSGSGFGLKIVGFANGAPIEGQVTL
jgi:hypothetical protein